MLKIRFSNERFGSGGVLLASLSGMPISAPDIDSLLQRIFVRADDTAPPAGFVGNKSSHVLHAAGCNHLPNRAQEELFADIDSALALGYRKCPACFVRIPPVRDYDTERALGLEASNRLRIQYPLTPDDARQRRIELAGKATLDKWLLPLRGYAYHFYAVESDELNAFACPTGIIYVTTALMDAAESDAELEAVLAHEIVHVELRHGYHEFRRAQEVDFWAAVIGGVGAAVVQAKIKSPEIAENVSRMVLCMSTLAAQIALAGYSREHESESDAYASAYLASRGSARGLSPLMAVLLKMRYATIASGQSIASTSSWYDSHPNLDARISTVESAVYARFDSTETFEGLDSDSEVVATLRFTCQSVSQLYEAGSIEMRGAGTGWGGITQTEAGDASDAEHVLATLQPHKSRLEFRAFAALSVAPSALRPMRVGGIVLHVGKQKFFLENDEDPVVGQGEQCGVSFTTRERDAILDGAIDGIDTDTAAGVKQWVRRR